MENELKPGTLEAFQAGMEAMRKQECEELGISYDAELEREEKDRREAMKAGWSAARYDEAMAGRKVTMKTGGRRGMEAKMLGYSVWPYAALDFGKTLLTNIPLAEVCFLDEWKSGEESCNCLDCGPDEDGWVAPARKCSKGEES